MVRPVPTIAAYTGTSPRLVKLVPCLSDAPIRRVCDRGAAARFNT
jgi:hypothetical protein